MDWVRLEVEGSVATIVMDAPPVNALSVPRLELLIETLRKAGEDDAVRAVVIASAVPSAFCAGLDLVDLQNRSPEEIRRLLDLLYLELWRVQRHLGKPSIAAINGAARGGGMTMAISCNMMIAGESASFGYPEIEVGLMPAIHLTHLPRLIGRHRAFDLLFSGRSFDAQSAKEMGFVSRVVPDAELRTEAQRLARVFAAKSPEAMRRGHAAFMQAVDGNADAEHLRAIEVFCALAETDEAREGIKAFAARRKPNWTRS